jgi:hypothetical protein
MLNMIQRVAAQNELSQDNEKEKNRELLREMLETGQPLPPYFFFGYFTLLKTSPREVGEKASHTDVGTKKIEDSWNEILENVKGGAFTPEGGWSVLKEESGWSALRSYLDGWGDGNSFGPVAQEFCEKRAEELEKDGVLDGFNADMHVQSLKNTVDLIDPYNN